MVRCIAGFVQQNMPPKVKALTCKDEEKSQRKAKTLKKNMWSEDETFMYFPCYMEETMDFSLRKCCGKGKVVR